MKDQDGSFQDMTVFGFGRKGHEKLVQHVADLDPRARPLQHRASSIVPITRRPGRSASSSAPPAAEDHISDRDNLSSAAARTPDLT